MQGRELVNIGATPERDKQARSLYERAISIDPDYAEAYAGLSEVYTRNFIFDRGDPTGRMALDKAILLGQRSLEIDPVNS